MNTDTANISVVIATYNDSNNIVQCLDSISNQSILPKEIIVVDDGSTDSTKNVIEKYMGDCKIPIKYYYQNNSGPGKARNLGIEKANSKWIAFQDSDDTWLSGKIEKQLLLVHKYHEIEFFSCNFTEWYCNEKNEKICKMAISSKSISSEIVINDYFNNTLKGVFASTPTVLATKRLLEIAGGFGPFRKGEDTDLWCRIGMLGVPVLYDNQSLVEVHVDSFRNFSKNLNLSERITQINNLYRVSIEKGRDKEFLPVARVLATEAINQLKFQGRNSEVAGFLGQLKLPLTRRFIIEEKLKARSPKIMGKLIPAYHRAKRLLR